MTQSWPQRIWCAALACVLLLLLAGPAMPIQAQDIPPVIATPEATPVTLPAALATPDATPAVSIATTAGTELSTEEQLVLRYAPMMVIKQQPEPCDTSGEQYLPAPVDVVFNDDTVVLRQAPSLEVVDRGIDASNLYELDDSFYIDLPGSPRTPGCDYERHFRQLMGDQRPVIYAHIAREEGKPGLAIQYWFFYYFNEFNDKHEGDWEMIQILFDDANTPREALLYGPTRVTYAQHSGGEPADWTDAKVDKVADRPVVYVASGSHASFYGPGIWLGWGRDGSGLGCDITTGPSTQIDPEVRLVPKNIDGPDHPFAWATFGGRWGERDTWVYNGPRGPNLNQRWTEPVSWQESVRAGSIRLQGAEVLGPQPTMVFCELAEAGSELLTLSRPYPWAVAGVIVAGLAVVAWFFIVARPTVRAAWSFYWRRIRFFGVLSGILVPFTVAFAAFMYVLHHDPRLGDLLNIDEDDPIVQMVTTSALLLQQGLLMLVVAPATIYAVAEFRAGRQPEIRAALREAIRRFWTIVRVEVITTVLVFLMSATIVGIPWAIMWSVRWTFGPQMVMLEGKANWEALRSSSELVKHRWWRTALTNLVLVSLSSATGPVVGLTLLILLNVAQEITNGVSSTIYAIAYPIAVTGMTLLYFQFREAHAASAAPTDPEPASPAPADSAAPPSPDAPGGATAPGGPVAPEPA